MNAGYYLIMNKESIDNTSATLRQAQCDKSQNMDLGWQRLQVLTIIERCTAEQANFQNTYMKTQLINLISFAACDSNT